MDEDVCRDGHLEKGSTGPIEVLGHRVRVGDAGVWGRSEEHPHESSVRAEVKALRDGMRRGKLLEKRQCTTSGAMMTP